MRISRRQVLLGTVATGTTVALGQFNLAALAAEGAKTFILPLARPAGNLDPQRYVGVFAVQGMIFDPLVHYGRGGALGPALAESWTVSDDQKTYTFKLRPNVVFSDGSPWNAEAMVWNLSLIPYGNEPEGLGVSWAVGDVGMGLSERQMLS